MKITWQQRYDGLALGEEIPRILLAQCYTPGLGLHPRTLPAPLYWADGIAAASDDDLRFRGRPVTRLG